MAVDGYAALQAGSNIPQSAADYRSYFAALQAGSNIPQSAADYRSCLAVGNGHGDSINKVDYLLRPGEVRAGPARHLVLRDGGAEVPPPLPLLQPLHHDLLEWHVH